MDELALALGVDRNVRVRGGQEKIKLPEGIVVRRYDLPQVHFLNAILLRAPLAGHLDAPALCAMADRWLGHLSYRYLVLDDPAAERLAPALLAAGWERRRTVFMVFRGDPKRTIRDPRARELTDAELRELQRANFAQADFGPSTEPGLVAMLLAAQAALRAGTECRGFGAGDDGRLQSMCTLFLHRDEQRRVAMLEEVGTLIDHRQRGLAKAVVSAAVTAADAWGADLIVVPTDADDWPQLLYAKLGFAPVGTQVSFTLRLGSGSSAV